MRTLSAVLFALCFGVSSEAFSCSEPIAFSDEQAKELLVKIENLDRSDFATILEFNRLLCAERRIVRDSARDVGRRSDVASIQSMALQSSLFEKDLINLTVLPKENMSEDERDFFQKNPLISYRVVAVDSEKGCLSIYNKNKCDPRYLLSISGSEVDVRYGSEVGKLRLTDQGQLRGIWSNGDQNRPVSVPVELRLD